MTFFYNRRNVKLMNLKYLIIPSIAFLTAAVGSLFTSGGMQWYKTINLPTWTPPGSTIGIVWTILFALAAISAILVWSPAKKLAQKTTYKKQRRTITIVFLTNIFLNVFWSYLFFNQHDISLAIVDSALLGLSVLLLMWLIKPISKTASLLLAPYAAWVAFATYLTYAISTIN